VSSVEDLEEQLGGEDGVGGGLKSSLDGDGETPHLIGCQFRLTHKSVNQTLLNEKVMWVLRSW
jgi:hypothetical protein